MDNLTVMLIEMRDRLVILARKVDELGAKIDELGGRIGE